MATDILLNDDKTFKVVNGDFAIGESDAQHVEHHLLLHKCELKDAVYVGIGIEDTLKAPLTPSVKTSKLRELRLSLEADNAKRLSLNWNANIEVDATYE